MSLIGTILGLLLRAVLALFGKKPRESVEQKLGQEQVKTSVSADALKKAEEARRQKEKADAKIRDLDYNDRVDRL